MSAPVFVLGGYQSDFARNLAREGGELVDLVGEAVDGALAAAGVEAGDVDAIHVGNAFGELFAGQAQLGAMPATARPALWGVPATRHEAACASGSVALLAAMAAIEAGRAQCALVVGVEQERNVTGEQAARHMGSAAWIGHEGQGARYLWPHMFARIADAYDQRWGLEPRHLAAIAQKNLGNARANPLAQARGWRFGDDAFAARWADDAVNPIIEGRLRRLDCSQVTDGAAAIVVASAAFAARRAPWARLLGWGHRTAGLGLDAKLARGADAPYLLPHLRDAITDAYRRAEVRGPEDLAGAEVHDCFSITEYLAIDHLGVTPPGQAGRALDDGTVARGGAFAINPSGGLIGGGHPVGASGVRMIVDAARQVSGTAGDYQVAGARRFATLNIGGSGTTACAFVLGAP